MTRHKQFMSEEVWTTILYRYILPYRRVNQFCPPTFIGHKDTEPLIDRKLPARLCDLATHAPDMNIDIYSNGVLLPVWHNRGQDFIKFLGSLPNRCRYLMSYHPFNHDNTENDYRDTITYMKGILSDPPRNVEFITVSHKSRWVSEDMQDKWKREWQGYPITVHCNCSINPWTGRIQEEGTTRFNGCPYADFGHLFIGVTGNVIGCCLDLEEEIILGHVLHDDPAEVMTRVGAFYAEQKRILESKELHPRGVCRNCFGQQRDDFIQLGVKG